MRISIKVKYFQPVCAVFSEYYSLVCNFKCASFSLPCNKDQCNPSQEKAHACDEDDGNDLTVAEQDD